jgi:hypothetical protein
MASIYQLGGMTLWTASGPSRSNRFRDLLAKCQFLTKITDVENLTFQLKRWLVGPKDDMSTR